MKVFSAILSFFLLMQTSYSSQIGLMDSAKLEEISDFIVIAKVIEVKELSSEAHTGIQEIKLQLKKSLKGNLVQKAFTLNLSYKGVKDFNPQMKLHQSAVFFLKKADNGNLSLAYPGAIAIFTQAQIQ